VTTKKNTNKKKKLTVKKTVLTKGPANIAGGASAVAETEALCEIRNSVNPRTQPCIAHTQQSCPVNPVPHSTLCNSW
jgi:hypothetical protein